MGWERNSIFKYYISYGIVLLLAISISANEIDNSIKNNKKLLKKLLYKYGNMQSWVI